MAFLPASSENDYMQLCQQGQREGMALHMGCLELQVGGLPGHSREGCLLLPPPLSSRPAWTLLQGRNVRAGRGQGWLTDGKAPRCSPSGPQEEAPALSLVGVPVCLFLPLFLPPGSWLLASTCHPGDPVNVPLNTRQASEILKFWDSICVAHCCIPCSNRC